MSEFINSLDINQFAGFTLLVILVTGSLLSLVLWIGEKIWNMINS